MVDAAPAAPAAAKAEPAPTLADMAKAAQPGIAASLDALGYPPALRDLMAAENIDDEILRHAVFQRGCYPEDVPLKQYAPELVENIVAKWPQWLAFIRENSDIPF